MAPRTPHVHHTTGPTRPTSPSGPAGPGGATSQSSPGGAAAGPPPVPPVRSGWGRWSQAWTRQAHILAGRTDLTVTVAPGAGHGSPACFFPARAAIEVDADLIGDPTVTDPRRPGHKKTVPTAYGALVHEAAHARASHWTSPPGTPPVLTLVADLLEESRAENRQRRSRPRDKQWLRHAVTQIIDTNDAPTDTHFNAAYAAGLLLARVDARILTSADVTKVRAAVTRVLGRPRLRKLRTIWRAALATGDTDGAAMHAHARDWCAVLGIDPDQQPAIPDPNAGTSTRIAEAIAAVLDAIAGRIPSPGPSEPDPPGSPNSPFPSPPPSTRDSGTGHSGSRRSGTGDSGLGHPGASVTVSPIPARWTPRSPRPAEQQAAGQLAALLRRARTREPVRTPIATVVPPGRLNARAAVTAAAQASAGALPTAQPWRRTVQRPAPEPELKIAVLIDVSGTMRAFAPPMSSAAWILAHAAVRVHAASTTIAFGRAVTVLTAPGQRPTHVHDLQATDNAHRFNDAVAVADRLLGLTTPGAARLLVLVSDGLLHGNGIPEAQATLTQLLHAGCAVLVLTPDTDRIHTYPGPTTIRVADPADCAALIGRAAAQALTRR
ncbi:VWA domain-containing protein [Cryptosporangium phraense]|uniref:VWA domain-containing protein n=1 Tax=Cryptosporangium phraense TaxID=2593070 RepID=A0A545ANJ6_9ACTN|nr:VWA domain-containing protein [Cryptosporangium phraense]TQS42840.1 VWA domain-containing protein [Cryptosporangium phraense]